LFGVNGVTTPPKHLSLLVMFLEPGEKSNALPPRARVGALRHRRERASATIAHNLSAVHGFDAFHLHLAGQR
jgi:hypothetical protein